eukprot:UN09375
MGDAVISGAATGAGVGAFVGGIGGGLPGLVGGMIGGAVVGAGIGALCALVNPYESTTKFTTKTSSVCVKSEMITYSGKDQAEALDKIVSRVEASASFKKLKEELEKIETTRMKS